MITCYQMWHRAKTTHWYDSHSLFLSLRFISELYKTFLSVTLPFVRASTATNIIIAVIVKSVRSRTSVSHEIKIIKHLTLDNKLQVKWQRNIIIFRQLLFFFFIFLFFFYFLAEKNPATFTRTTTETWIVCRKCFSLFHIFHLTDGLRFGMIFSFLWECMCFVLFC